MFTIAVLFYYFPQLESFKAFSIEAKLRERIGQAEEILNRIDRSALATARHLYIYLSSSVTTEKFNDWAGKVQLSQDAASLLTELKLSDEQRQEIAKPFIDWIAHTRDQRVPR